jgi:hypothetical protein
VVEVELFLEKAFFAFSKKAGTEDTTTMKFTEAWSRHDNFVN